MKSYTNPPSCHSDRSRRCGYRMEETTCNITAVKRKRHLYPLELFSTTDDALQTLQCTQSETPLLSTISLPSSQGTIDDIAALGKIAYNHDIGLHVDCCLGGFILPFAKKLGYSIPGNSLYMRVLWIVKSRFSFSCDLSPELNCWHRKLRSCENEL